MTRDSRRPWPWRSGALLALVVCLAAPLVAQQRPQTSQQQPTFRAGVELVQIDVIVLDETGAHVRGLKASDFVIRDRGKVQTIAAFEEVAHARPGRTPSGAAAPPNVVPLDVSTNQTAAADRLVVVVVDDLHIWRGRTTTAQSIARGILDTLGPDASMAVLFTSGRGGTQVTEDRTLLQRAIDSLEGRQSVRRPNQAVDTQKPKPNDPEAPIDVTLANIQESQNTNLQQFSDNMTLFGTLEDAARLMGASDARRKAFVLVSEGLSKNPTGIFGMMSETPRPPAGGEEYVDTGDPVATIAAPPVSYHDFALIDMIESMRRSNVATYAIDPRGEVTAQEVMLELHPAPAGFDVHDPVFRWDNPLRIAQDGLETVAEASGGFAIVNTDDFTSGIERIIDDLDHYYLVGFYPADTKGKDFRPLNVRVPSHPGWTIRFRRGYKPGGTTKPRADANPLVVLSAGVLPRTDLALRFGAVPLATNSGEDTRVAVTLEVSASRAALQDADGRLRDELSYEVLAVDEKRREVTRAGGLKARATLSPAGTPSPEIVTYQVADTITLPPGTYQLRASAQSARLKTGGSVYLNVEVPDFRRVPVAIGGLAIGYAGGPRVPEAPVAARLTPASRLPFAATLDRVFASSDVLRVYFEVAAGGTPQAMPGRLEILAADGVTVRSSLDFTSNDQGQVDVTVPMSDLDTGAYILRATVSHGGEKISREVGIELY